MVKIVSAISTLLFLSFAFLQLNDPDPIFWTVLYIGVSIVTFLPIIGRERKKIALASMVVVIIVSLFYAPGFFEWLSLPDKDEIFGEMVYQKPYIEETREFLGSIIALLALIYQYIKA